VWIERIMCIEVLVYVVRVDIFSVIFVSGVISDSVYRGVGE
jgi:hypothetical protein